MANIVLTENACQQAEELAIDILGYKSLIESSVITFDYVINNPDIQMWMTDTQVGQELYQKVKNNNEALKELASSVYDIYQATMNLVADSRRSNNTY